MRMTAVIVFLSLAGCLPGASTRPEPLNDPSLGITAATFNVPAKWHFQGVLMQGGPCVGIPFAVFRMTSPDGLSFVEQLPKFGWIFATGPAASVKHDGCLPLKTALGAQEFLKYISATLNVQYLNDEPVSPSLKAKLFKEKADAEAVYAPQYAAAHLQPPKSTLELAWAAVRYRNGSFVIKGRLQTVVSCNETTTPGMKSMLRGMADRPESVNTSCQASVRYISAPENQFPSVAALIDDSNIGPVQNQAWVQAWISRSNQQAQQMMSQMNAAFMAQSRASAQQFAHDQAVRQQMHEQFLATMQRGTDLSMQRAAEASNSRQRQAADVVDSVLDRQTVRDPNTGQVSKVSSAYSYTWVDSTGKTSFQTQDPNANPNGTLQGNWTRQEVTHADGTAK